MTVPFGPGEVVAGGPDARAADRARIEGVVVDPRPRARRAPRRRRRCSPDQPVGDERQRGGSGRCRRAAAPSAHAVSPSRSRSRASAANMRLLTVPSGTPSRSASSAGTARRSRRARAPGAGRAAAARAPPAPRAAAPGPRPSRRSTRPAATGAASSGSARRRSSRRTTSTARRWTSVSSQVDALPRPGRTRRPCARRRGTRPGRRPRQRRVADDAQREAVGDAAEAVVQLGERASSPRATSASSASSEVCERGRHRGVRRSLLTGPERVTGSTARRRALPACTTCRSRRRTRRTTGTTRANARCTRGRAST